MKPFLTATLTLSPGINESYGPKSDGTGIISKEVLRQFKQDAVYVLYSQKQQQDWDVINSIRARPQREHTPLEMTIDFYFTTLWKRDIDGPEKSVIDAVFEYLEWQGQIIFKRAKNLNDNLIVKKTTTKQADRDNPRCEISLGIKESLK